jgi:glycosyltransferase 2 family protein
MPAGEDVPSIARTGGGWRSLLGLLAGLLVGGLAMFFLGVSRQEMLAALHDAAAGPLVLAALGSLVLLAFQSLRWWLVMRPVVKLPYHQAYGAMTVGFLCNVILPARGGDVLRVLYLSQRTGVSRAKLFGTEIVDLTSDKWGWIAAFGVMCLVDTPPAWLFRALGVLFALLAAGSLLLVAMGSQLFRGQTRRVPAWITNLREGFAAQHWKRLLVLETLVAPLPWFWETLLIVVAARSLGISLTAMQAFATLTAFNLASVVPSPGNMGSFEAGGAVAMVHFGVAHSTAVAFMVLYHLTQVLPGIALGSIILARHGSFGLLRARRRPMASIETPPVEPAGEVVEPA